MMKKLVAGVLVVAFMSIGCGDVKTIDGITYDTFGVFTMQTDANPNIRYELIIGNVIWSVLLFPLGAIYFVGFSLYEPVGSKNDGHVKGSIY